MSGNVNCLQAQPDRNLLRDLHAEDNLIHVATAGTALVYQQADTIEYFSTIFDQPAYAVGTACLLVRCRKKHDVSIQSAATSMQTKECR